MALMASDMKSHFLQAARLPAVSVRHRAYGLLDSRRASALFKAGIDACRRASISNADICRRTSGPMIMRADENYQPIDIDWPFLRSRRRHADQPAARRAMTKKGHHSPFFHDFLARRRRRLFPRQCHGTCIHADADISASHESISPSDDSSRASAARASPAMPLRHRRCLRRTWAELSPRRSTAARRAFASQWRRRMSNTCWFEDATVTRPIPIRGASMPFDRRFFA